MRRGQDTSRRGAAYLVALLAGTIVTVTGLAALSLATTRARSAELGDQLAGARLNASTALEHAFAAVSAHLDNAGTRHDLFGNAEPTVAWQGGTSTWRLREMDGSLLDNKDGPIVIQAEGASGDSAFRYDAMLVPSGRPMGVLNAAMYAGGTITVSSGGTLIADHVVAAAGDITANGGTVDADVESSGDVDGAVYLGSITEDADPRPLPDIGMLTYYRDLGFELNHTELPWVLLSRTLGSVLLSPASNPFGPPNPLGIYVIDCNNSSIVVTNTRINGTLILRRPGPNTIIGSGVFIEPVHPWLPAIVAEGSITFMASAAGPNETLLGVNLNPPGSPYLFEHDTDQSDTYPGVIRGVVYASGNITFGLLSQHIEGAVIAGGNIRVFTGSTARVTYDPSVAHLPPFGFFEDQGQLAVDPSTITWTMP